MVGAGAGMGDDVQAIKAGIMEIADVFVINKSDLPGVEGLEQEIRAVQSLSGKERDVSRCDPPCIATKGAGNRRVAERDRSGSAEQKCLGSRRAGNVGLHGFDDVRERSYAAVPEAAIIEAIQIEWRSRESILSSCKI